MARKQKNKYIRLNFRTRRIRVLLDEVLLFRYIRRLHGRFWGLAGISFMLIGFSVGFLIRPEMLRASTAFSDFGNDVRTAPYFAGAVFFAAYGLWRWRNYLSRTWKRAMPVTGLITLTVLGLYIVALVPLSWNSRLHMFGVVLAGISMLATVVLDGILTKTRSRKHVRWWRLIHTASLLFILSGGWLTFGSAELIDWYNVALVGESLMLLGYLLWIGLKTYLGEGGRSTLSRMLKDVVQIS